MTQDKPDRGLIAGAGPAGLAAGLFLARAGHVPRIVERAVERSPYSRALAVNPRTLALLEPTGVTEQLLAVGRRITGATIWRHGKPHVRMELSQLADFGTRYPFMLALSQRVTEDAIERAFVAAGGVVERGPRLTGCDVSGPRPVAILRDAAGAEDHVEVGWLLGADGSHSATREALGLSFDGSTFDREWHLADVPMATSALDEDRAHVVFLDGGGFVFCLRVVDDASSPAVGGTLWRTMGNVPDPAGAIAPLATPSGLAVWTSSFRIAHKIASRLSVGRVCLAGDAAHVHSPAGARGMNLGIEDAWAFARHVAAGTIERYGSERRAIDRRVVRRVEILSRVARGESAAARFARGELLPLGVRVPAVRRQAMATLTGLDHAIEGLSS